VVFEDAHVIIRRLGVRPNAEQTVRALPEMHSVLLAVRVDGATVDGQAAHAGEGWDGAALHVHAGAAPVEMVQIALK
jgi:hypothetical protein